MLANLPQETFNLTCSVVNTGPDSQLGFEIWADQQKIFDSTKIQHETTIACSVTLLPGPHVLKFVMKNKNSSHTTINSAGEIVTDACLLLKNTKFNNFEVDQKIIDLATYQHNYNGNGDTVKEKFWLTFGCNGVVTLPFSTPVYDWLCDTYE
jgi:hypothetical protein